MSGGPAAVRRRPRCDEGGEIEFIDQRDPSPTDIINIYSFSSGVLVHTNSAIIWKVANGTHESLYVPHGRRLELWVFFLY